MDGSIFKKKLTIPGIFNLCQTKILGKIIFNFLHRLAFDMNKTNMVAGALKFP